MTRPLRARCLIVRPGLLGPRSGSFAGPGSGSRHGPTIQPGSLTPASVRTPASSSSISTSSDPNCIEEDRLGGATIRRASPRARPQVGLIEIERRCRAWRSTRTDAQRFGIHPAGRHPPRRSATPGRGHALLRTHSFLIGLFLNRDFRGSAGPRGSVRCGSCRYRSRAMRPSTW